MIHIAIHYGVAYEYTFSKNGDVKWKGSMKVCYSFSVQISRERNIIDSVQMACIKTL